MLQVACHHNHTKETITLSTIGLVQKGRPELVLEGLPVMPESLCELVGYLVELLACEVEEHDLGNGMVVSVGSYGHVKFEAGKLADNQDILWIRDVEANTKNANSFIRRLMALKGFEYMDLGTPTEAINCFNIALKLQPDDAILLQARASAKIDLVMQQRTAGASGLLLTDELETLLQSALEDLYLSIEMAPDHPEAYRDLLTLLQSISPQAVDRKPYHRWVSEVVEIALSHPTDNPDVFAERAALRTFSLQHGIGHNIRDH